ncbi:MAG: hypothetical protein ABGW98_12250 [Myxococcales bacterium]
MPHPQPEPSLDRTPTGSAAFIEEHVTVALYSEDSATIHHGHRSW